MSTQFIYTIDKPNSYRVIRDESNTYFEILPYPNGWLIKAHRDGFVIRTKHYLTEDNAVRTMWNHVAEFGINRKNSVKQIIPL